METTIKTVGYYSAVTKTVYTNKGLRTIAENKVKAEIQAKRRAEPTSQYNWRINQLAKKFNAK